MANTNTTTSVVDTIFARCLLALREISVMPRYVNRGYDPTPGDKFSSIDIPIPSAIAAAAVTPSYVPPDDAGVSPTKVTITLDKWYETAFFINDKEVEEIVGGVFEGQLSEAIRGLANQVDTDLAALYKGLYGYAGVAGTTPFRTGLDEFTAGRAVLARQLAAKDPRVCLIDEDAEANLLLLPAVTNLSHRGSTALRDGEVGELYRTMFAFEQNLPRHTAGTITTGLAAKAATAQAVGDKTIVCTTAASTGACALVEGDIITFAGDDQTYVMTAAGTQASANTDVTLNIEPGLKIALAGGEAVSVKASHKVNLLMHRDCMALAARPMSASDPFGLNPNRRAIMDPVSGLSLSMEITRQHYRTRIALSSLYGVKLVRREFGCRLPGE